MSIYNPIDIKGVSQCAQEEIEHPWFMEKIPLIISIGRLTQQKGFYFLLKALAVVVENGYPCRLVILGEGQERLNLQKLAENFGINSWVSFMGFKRFFNHFLWHSAILSG